MVQPHLDAVYGRDQGFAKGASRGTCTCIVHRASCGAATVAPAPQACLITPSRRAVAGDPAAAVRGANAIGVRALLHTPHTRSSDPDNSVWGCGSGSGLRRCIPRAPLLGHHSKEAPHRNCGGEMHKIDAVGCAEALQVELLSARIPSACLPRPIHPIHMGERTDGSSVPSVVANNHHVSHASQDPYV